MTTMYTGLAECRESGLGLADATSYLYAVRNERGRWDVMLGGIQVVSDCDYETAVSKVNGGDGVWLG